MVLELIEKKNKKQLDELKKQLELLQIDKKSVCIVGSFVLALNKIRNNYDLDLVILPKIKKKISKKKKAFHVTKNIEIVGNEWAKTNGLFRGREKNFKDIKNLEKFALNSKQWNWNLIRDIIPKSKIHDFKIKKPIKKVKITKNQIRKYQNVKLGKHESTSWSWIFLWPPAKPWFDEISQELSKHSTKKWEKTINLGKTLPDFIRKMYSMDDIQKWKIELKINAMQNSSPTVRIIAMEFPDDTFRIKKDVTSYQSNTAILLKKFIRKKFGMKVPNYFYDIIIHIGDNHKHNRKTYELLKKGKYLT